MLNIGIYLGWAPQQSMHTQGIGRLTAFIIETITTNHKITIACPKWYEEQLYTLLDDFNIEHNKVEILTTSRIPISIKIAYKLMKLSNNKQARGLRALINACKNYIHTKIVNYIESSTPLSNNKFSNEFRKKCKKNIRSGLYRFIQLKVLFYDQGFWRLRIFSHIIKQYVKKLIIKFISADTLLNFITIGIKLLLIFLLLAIVSPFYIAGKLATKTVSTLKKNHKIYKVLNKLKQYRRWSPLDFKQHPLIIESYNRIREKELKKLAISINKRSDITTWYIPSMLWPEIKEINATKVVCAPDVVFFDFPTDFKSTNNKNTLLLIQETIKAANKLICYSEYVKEQHFLKELHIEPDKITVIKHGWVDLSKYCDNKTDPLHQSRRLLNDYYVTMPKPSIYLHNLNISHVSFFFYSSQDRPYKNFLNLIKAYEYALRKKYVTCKLIITAKITDPAILDYIVAHRLQFDIISMPDVPNNILAALNNLAICSVNPSYFEGGFPFTFSEAYSVGTPSIMSNIPAVRETIDDPQLIDLMLFDPTNYKDMGEKMAWAFNNRALLLEKQKGLAETLKARTWEKVAAEYIETMQQITAEKALATTVPANELLVQEPHKQVILQEYS